MNEFRILAAQHGGFIVMHDAPQIGMMREPLFAGSLADALEFIRKQFADRAPISDVRAAA